MKITKFEAQSVRWVPAPLPVPVTSKMEGNGSDPHFEVKFFIGYCHGDVRTYHMNNLSLIVRVPADGPDQPNDQVVASASQQISDVLRQLADALQQDTHSAQQKQ